MPKFAFNKLVRDSIVDYQISSGSRPKYHMLGPKQHKKELVKKIIEEAKEITRASASDVASELADVQQALDDLKALYKLSDADLDKVQAEKRLKNGGFKKGYYVEYLDIDEDHEWFEYYRRNSDRYPEIK